MTPGQIGCPKTSKRFLNALLAEKGIHTPASNPVTQSLDCGHSEEHAYRYEGELLCRKCRKVRRYEAYRETYLPEAIDNTKRKLEALEREAKARGVIV